MNLIRDIAILDLQRRNVEVLQEQVRQTRDRFNVGEVTRTDVAQSESRLAAARATMMSAMTGVMTKERRNVPVKPILRRLPHRPTSTLNTRYAARRASGRTIRYVSLDTAFRIGNVGPDH